MVKIEEDDFLDLFNTNPHLSQLTHVGIEFNGIGPLTERTVNYLVNNLPRLTRLDNLVTWDLGRDSICAGRLRREHGLGVIYASRSHWSLCWKNEDGTFFESEFPVDRF